VPGHVQIIGIILLVVFAVVAAFVAAGVLRWRVGTRQLRTRLDASRVTIEPRVVDFRELASLPAPVQRYFRKVIEDGQPVVAGARVKHRGKFNIGDTIERWKPFKSNQRVVTQRRGFDWDARVSMMPGFTVCVHDSYVAGEGGLRAAFLGLFSLIAMRGTHDVAEGQLMRYLAEATWYPTALLPSQGVSWKGVDDRSARATLVDGEVTLSMLFTFTDDDLVDTVSAEARGRAVGDSVIPTPWQGRVWNYQTRDGMLVPLQGEVAWIFPEGARPYWRGRITEIEYEFAG